MRRIVISSVLALFGLALFAPDADACGRRGRRGKCQQQVWVGVSVKVVQQAGCVGGRCR